MTRINKLLPLALCALVVAACSNAVTTATATPAAIQGIDSNKTIHLGAFIAQSGPLASASNVGLGVQFYLDKTNAAGGVNGYKFDYKILDDAADPTKTVTAVKQLWEQDQVFGLLVPYGTGGNSAVKQYVISNNIPTFFPYANAAVYFPTGEAPANVFGFQADYTSEVMALAQFASKQQGVKKIAVLHTTDAFGQSGTVGIQAAAKSLGLTVAADVGYDTTETNFAPFGQRIAASGADAVVLWAIPGSYQAMAAAQQAGFKGIWLVGDLFRGGFYLSQLVKIPNVAGRTYLVFHQKTTAQFTAAGSDFVSQFKAKYPKGDPDPALTGWTGAAMFVEAVKEATAGNKPLTMAGLRQALESWKKKAIEAAVGLSFTKTNHVGAIEGQMLALNSDNTWSVAQDFQTLPTP
jgi:branched-chain amino acid transport system substrate-binding protein